MEDGALKFLEWLFGLSPVIGMILVVLGFLVVIGQGVIALTPTKADDAAWEKIKAVPILGSIIRGIEAFAPIQRKEPGVVISKTNQPPQS